MNGDVIRRIGQYKEVIAHYHTVGNPGRAELDATQEINYPAVMQAILATGYRGFVAQELDSGTRESLADSGITDSTSGVRSRECIEEDGGLRGGETLDEEIGRLTC